MPQTNPPTVFDSWDTKDGQRGWTVEAWECFSSHHQKIEVKVSDENGDAILIDAANLPRMINALQTAYQRLEPV